MARKDNVVSLGFVTGLDYADPRLDPQHVLQEFKQHPFVAKLLEGGKMIRYGAKSMPYGGWWAIPPVAGNGWMILGDSAGFLNSARLKGIHLAIKSGMLAAETAFEALKKDDSSAATLGGFQKKVESSWIKEELWKVRNLHQGFEHGMFAGMFHTGLQMITGGRGLRNRYPAKAGYEHMRKLAELPADGGAEAHLLGPAKGDGKLTFDKLTDLYHSGTKHEEDQPAHLVIHDTNICNTRCVKEFGSPCQNFCPGERLRNGRRRQPAQRQAHQPEPVQLRPLQNLRHRRPVPDHHLGPAGRRRRPELRRHVTINAPVGTGAFARPPSRAGAPWHSIPCAHCETRHQSFHARVFDLSYSVSRGKQWKIDSCAA